MSNKCKLIYVTILFLLLTACNTQYPEACLSSTPIGMRQADEIASNDDLPFRFPLDESSIDETLYFGWFGVSNECTPDIKDCYEYPVVQFHAAEDYRRPAGTPVYAMADGRISFSGTAGGYGWLVIINHPQANLYSLYGHLSPSRWKLKSGTDVKKGELIAYLGDPDENGGSKENPLVPHLHFGVRAGQTADYPGKGEWRFMAGWIRLCPQDLGWLQPSLIITSQDISVGVYPKPSLPFLARWGVELLVTSAFGMSGAAMIVMGIRKKSPFPQLLPGPILIIAGIIFFNEQMISTHTLLGIGIVLMLSSIYLFVRQMKQKKKT